MRLTKEFDNYLAEQERLVKLADENLKNFYEDNRELETSVAYIDNSVFTISGHRVVTIEKEDDEYFVEVEDFDAPTAWSHLSNDEKIHIGLNL